MERKDNAANDIPDEVGQDSLWFWVYGFCSLVRSIDTIMKFQLKVTINNKTITLIFLSVSILN
jgi:hypothetical protein